MYCVEVLPPVLLPVDMLPARGSAAEDSSSSVSDSLASVSVVESSSRSLAMRSPVEKFAVAERYFVKLSCCITKANSVSITLGWLIENKSDSYVNPNNVFHSLSVSSD